MVTHNNSPKQMEWKDSKLVWQPPQDISEQRFKSGVQILTELHRAIIEASDHPDGDCMLENIGAALDSVFRINLERNPCEPAVE